MHSTLQQTDPHDAFLLEPDVGPARANHASPDQVHEVLTLLSQRRARMTSGVPKIDVSKFDSPPSVDTTFRAATVDDIRIDGDRPAIGRWARKASIAFLFALCSAFAAGAWQYYGADARQMIPDWAPPLAPVSSPPAETTAPAGQGDAPAVEAAAADQPSPPNAATAPPAEAAAPATAAPSADAAQLQSMARDLAAMGQQIEQLKASIAELRAGQQAMARDVPKASEIKPVVQNVRPKMSTPLRSQVAPRRPVPAYYAPVQAAAPPPQQLPPPASLQPAPPPPAAAQFDGDEPVLRPPMPLR